MEAFPIAEQVSAVNQWLKIKGVISVIYKQYLTIG